MRRRLPAGTHSYRYATKCSECEAGKHAPITSMEDCVTCASLGERWTSAPGAKECVCITGRCQNVALGNCALCTEGMKCNTIGRVCSEDYAYRRQMFVGVGATLRARDRQRRSSSRSPQCCSAARVESPSSHAYTYTYMY